ncbi:MAG: hypothetical protein KDA28_05340, partial [Phycisphaerales bacterium]|nr:hypothetical protein [Phycisphaerales bacterium]
LTPAPSTVDPTVVAFEAGRRAGGRHLHVWQGATALLLALSAAQFVSVPTDDRQPPYSPPRYAVQSAPYLDVRTSVFRDGVDGLDVITGSETGEPLPRVTRVGDRLTRTGLIQQILGAS